MLSSRRVSRCLSAALVLAGAGLCTAPMSGCQAMNGMMSKSAMDMLAPALKDAANSYLSNVGQLTSMLQNIGGYQDAINFVQKAEPMVKQASSAYQTLAATSGQDRTNLLSAFGSQFKSANSGFTSQVDKLTGKSGWGQLLSPAIDRVKLFQ